MIPQKLETGLDGYVNIYRGGYGVNENDKRNVIINFVGDASDPAEGQAVYMKLMDFIQNNIGVNNKVTINAVIVNDGILESTVRQVYEIVKHFGRLDVKRIPFDKKDRIESVLAPVLMQENVTVGYD